MSTTDLNALGLAMLICVFLPFVIIPGIKLLGGMMRAIDRHFNKGE